MLREKIRIDKVKVITKNDKQMKKILWTTVFTTVFAFEHKSYAQTYYPDAGMWTTFSIEKELSSRFSISADEEFRLKENLTMPNLFYTNLGITYKLSKRLKFTLTYRLTEKWKYQDQYFSFRNRLMFDVSYKYKFNDWIVSYRSRIQSEVRDINTSELGKIPEWYWRNKVDIKYKIRR